NESSASNISSDTIAILTSQNQDIQDSSGGIDNQTKMYRHGNSVDDKGYNAQHATDDESTNRKSKPIEYL
ncbi:15730_t:CDS:1, partial [Gigaspora rosea]